MTLRLSCPTKKPRETMPTHPISCKSKFWFGDVKLALFLSGLSLDVRKSKGEISSYFFKRRLVN